MIRLAVSVEGQTEEENTTGLGQEPGAGLIADQERVLALLGTAPTDPTVPGARVQSKGVPPTLGQPAIALHGDLSHAIAAVFAEPRQS